MTGTLTRRLERLETMRRAREPIGGLILLGTEETLEEQLAHAIADGRYKPGAPFAADRNGAA